MSNPEPLNLELIASKVNEFVQRFPVALKPVAEVVPGESLIIFCGAEIGFPVNQPTKQAIRALAEYWVDGLVETSMESVLRGMEGESG